MDLFRKAFSIVMERDSEIEDIAEPGAPAATPANDKEAMAQKLDTAKPEDFNVKGGVTSNDVIKEKQKVRLGEWIVKIDEFIEYLNGTTDSSVQTQLHAAQCETIFQDIARSEKKKIARLAAELSSLSESFKGYLISSTD